MFKELSDCDDCGGETKHQVAIELRQEAESYHSKEPYRVTRCEKCGCEEASRINSK